MRPSNAVSVRKLQNCVRRMRRVSEGWNNAIVRENAGGSAWVNSERVQMKGKCDQVCKQRVQNATVSENTLREYRLRWKTDLICLSGCENRVKNIANHEKPCGGLANRGEPRRTVANRGGSPPPRTEPWRHGAVRGANRTVGVAHGSVCERTAPRGSRFEPWSTLIIRPHNPLEGRISATLQATLVAVPFRTGGPEDLAGR